MDITVLCENTDKTGKLLPEHGLSLFLETKKHRALFDMGQSDAFYKNALNLGVDLTTADTAFLSHGHYDHTGGLEKFLEINKDAPVYLSRNAFGEFYNAAGMYIGMKESLKSTRLKPVGDTLILDDEMSFISCNDRKRKYKTDPYGLCIKENGRLKPDTFIHELYLMVKENGRKILLSGCSHKGLLNILEWFDPDVFIGGFHFMNLDPDTDDRHTLNEISKLLLQKNTVYYTGHCTGEKQFLYLKEAMGDRLNYISTGEKVRI